MLAIIGMSPWNSYFKDKEVAYLLKETIKRYGKAAILVADIPAISTYIAMWYGLSQARSKAVLKWNNLKNRTKKLIQELWIDENDVIIVDRDNEIKDNSEYSKHFATVQKLYNNNELFRKSVTATSQEVLQHSWKQFSPEDIEKATEYLLSEIAFMEYAPAFFGVKKVAYVYHKNRFVFEDYISWLFDGKTRLYLDFILLESPYETYLSISENSFKNRRELINARGSIKCTFSPYFDYFTTKDEKLWGTFYELTKNLSKKLWVKFDFVEQSGYGVIADRLNSGYADMFCSPVRPTKERRLSMFFSKSLFQSNIFAYISSKSPYSKKDLNTLQKDKKLRIAVKENDIHHDIAREFFPNARLVWVPQLSDISEVLKFVIDNRADMTFWEDNLVDKYIKTNKLSSNVIIQKSFIKNKPIVTYDNCFAFPRWEFELKKIIDECL